MATELTTTDILLPTLTLLGFGAAAALACRALKISPIIGYLIAGVIIGPHALGLLEDNDVTQLLAELGVVFLLFDIGMHVSMRELKESRSDLLGLAPAHFVLSGAVFTLIAYLLGLSLPVAIAIGASLALSSTAVVARVLAERGLNSCPLGRASVHILIFQDIVAIFLLIFASALGEDAASLPVIMAMAAGQALIAFACALLAGRYLLGPFFRLLASTRNEEVFTAVTLLLVLGAATATFVMGLSLTLGAFLAGLAVSGTAFRHQIQTESGPFRGLLLSFFFISVGMVIDLPALFANLPLVLAIAVSILVLKTAAGYIAARINRWSVPGATQLSFLLAQGSEFTLVILAMLSVVSAALVGAGAAPLFDPVVETVTVAAIAFSLALAPFWADAGMRLSRQLAKRLKDAAPQATASGSPTGRPVIVFGMTPAGRLAVDALSEHDIPYVALDSDPDRFLAATADGYKVTFGDAANLKLIEAIGMTHARAVVIGAPRYDVSRALTPALATQFPGIIRFVAVTGPEDVERFSALGMRAYLSATQPQGIEMATDLLRTLEVEEADVRDWLADQADRFADTPPAEDEDKTPLDTAA